MNMNNITNVIIRSCKYIFINNNINLIISSFEKWPRLQNFKPTKSLRPKIEIFPNSLKPKHILHDGKTKKCDFSHFFHCPQAFFPLLFWPSPNFFRHFSAPPPKNFYFLFPKILFSHFWWFLYHPNRFMLSLSIVKQSFESCKELLKKFT